MKKSIVFKSYDGMAAKVGDIVYSAYIPEGEEAAVAGKVVYTNETQFIVDWPQQDILMRFARATAGSSLLHEVEQFFVNGFAVPAPLDALPTSGEAFVANPTAPAFYLRILDVRKSVLSFALSRGLLYASPADAIACAKAMVGIDPSAIAPAEGESLDDAYDDELPRRQVLPKNN